ncbi:two-component sensor histidine kinase [cyanobacterium endosymbiont of Rhopalodia gibberula]|uniref:sensor histidine kinase n=1 Tax=cyanobacterium endosymbiont of Rhopalodia gibberula TaxID=1763363 RepID=UPI000DC6F67D|nr:MASE1 domain-containing protein [cyanobacterium endosymbiont of Rhopalodia gibberula]BBA79814.1 two-component sensor histidine kinase [cyanobacterium endosymbiont of Rhopalodia gibberula]
MTLSQTAFRSNLVKLALVAIAYWSGGWICLRWMGIAAEASPLWLPAGIAITALLVYGEGVWFGIFLGDAILMVFSGENYGVALGSALGSTLSGVVAVRLLRCGKFSSKLSRIQDVTELIFLGAIISPLLNTSIDTLVQLVAGNLSSANFSQRWWLLWLGDCSGILVTTPLLLRFKFHGSRLLNRQKHFRLIELFICGGLLLVLSWLVFICQGSSSSVQGGGLTTAQYLEYLPFPVVVWAALRFQTWGAVLSNIFVAILAIAGTIEGIGPFVIQTHNLSQAVLSLQIFIIIVSATALLLSVAVTERQRVEKQLRDAVERDHLLAEVALRIRRSLDMEQIFKTTVAEIRGLIHADRVFIATLYNDGRLDVVAESVIPRYSSILGGSAKDDLLTDIQSLFARGQTFIVSDIDSVNLSESMAQYTQRYDIKAALVVPLHVDGQPLGLLVAHQCSQRRYWQKEEVRLLEQLADQMMIAMGQAKLYQKVQKLNNNLEKQVQEHTHQLQDKIQEVQQLYDMKAVFLQAVSHDLRTSIMGMLMLLKNLQNRQGENLSISHGILDRMIKSSDRQLTLINALSKDHFSEEFSLNMNMNLQAISLKEIVVNLTQSWQSCLIQNKATLILEISDNLPFVFADSDQLNQVFEHLLSNALKHNTPGINLVLKAVFNNGMIHCCLIDNGVGMEEKQCNQMFRLYLRSLHDRRRTGIGLGSYQCRQIIEAHGGKIGVNSTPGKGCQVWFTLPIAKSQPSAVS